MAVTGFLILGVQSSSDLSTEISETLTSLGGIVLKEGRGGGVGGEASTFNLDKLRVFFMTDTANNYLIPSPLLSLQIELRQRIEMKITKIVTINISPPRRLKSVSEEMENFISNMSIKLIYFLKLNHRAS